jgi:hypothetical protein
MEHEEYNRLCAIFIKTFASVPDKLRNEIIVVVDGQPYTWFSSYVEVKNKTEKSKKIIEELKKLKIID